MPPSIMIPRTPTLIPDFDTPFTHGREIDLDDNLSEFTGEGIFGTFARATSTIVVSNAGAQNDVVGITFAFASTTVVANGTPYFAQTAPLQATPTTTTTAAAIKDAINGTYTLNRLIVASNSTNTITLTAVNAGVLGNNIVSVLNRVIGTTFQTTTPSGFGTVGTFANGTGNIALPMETFVVSAGGPIVPLYAGRKILVPAGSALLTALQTCGRLVI